MKILSAFRFHLVIVLAAAAWVPLAAVPAARLDPDSRASARADWQAAPAEPAGTGRISVLVIAADTEKPITPRQSEHRRAGRIAGAHAAARGGSERPRNQPGSGDPDTGRTDSPDAVTGRPDG